MLAIITFIVGLCGAGLLSYGAYLFSKPLGFVVGGLLLIIWSYLSANAQANASAPEVSDTTKAES